MNSLKTNIYAGDPVHGSNYEQKSKGNVTQFYAMHYLSANSIVIQKKGYPELSKFISVKRTVPLV